LGSEARGKGEKEAFGELHTESAREIEAVIGFLSADTFVVEIFDTAKCKRRVVCPFDVVLGVVGRGTTRANNRDVVAPPGIPIDKRGLSAAQRIQGLEFPIRR
jgi:hypothetical protein